MTKEELNKIKEKIRLQKIMETANGYKETTRELQDKIDLYNYVVKLKDALDEIKGICYASYMIDPEYQEVLKVIDKVNELGGSN